MGVLHRAVHCTWDSPSSASGGHVAPVPLGHMVWNQAGGGSFLRVMQMTYIDKQRSFGAGIDTGGTCTDVVIVEMGFTPTDALNALGMLDLGDVEASRRGAAVLAQRCGTDVDRFCRNVLEATFQKIEDAILTHVIRREIGLSLTDFLAHRRESSILKIQPGLNVPIVGLGAAAGLLLPPVAQSLGCDLHLPDHHEVGSALGALLIGSEARSLA